MITGSQIEAAEVRVSGWARAVAMKRAVVTSVVGGLLILGVSRGWITPGVSGTVNADLAGALGFLSVVGAGAWIHRAVTPAEQSLQPVNSAGQNLVPDPAAADALAAYGGSSDATIGAAFDDAIAATAAPAGSDASTGAHAHPDSSPQWLSADSTTGTVLGEVPADEPDPTAHTDTEATA